MRTPAGPNNWLFVCTYNLTRGPTCEHVARKADLHADSAGTDPSAPRVLTLDRIQWARVIVCMEPLHMRRVEQLAGRLAEGKGLFTWHISDEFEYMSPDLIGIARQKLADTRARLAKKPLGLMDIPQAFSAWKEEVERTAQEHPERLEKAWQRTPARLRNYILSFHAAWWHALRHEAERRTTGGSQSTS